MARQIDLQKEHYSAITAQYENIRRIRHDISSHLYTVEALLKEGQYTEAAAYSAEVSEACRYRSNLGSCENPIVDAFLFSRTGELKTQDYEIQIQVRVPARTGIPDADMVVAFGNLLDNAVEACQAAEKSRSSFPHIWKRGICTLKSAIPLPQPPLPENAASRSWNGASAFTFFRSLPEGMREALPLLWSKTSLRQA